MNSIDKTLDERGERYGEFTGHAEVTQRLKRTMGRHPGWRKLADDQREALEMIAHKVGRILNGDPNYIDSWHDIIGYTRLVEQRLEREQTPETQSAQKPLDFDAAMRDVIDGFKAADEALQKTKTGAKSPLVDTCSCPACTLRRKLSAMFPGAEIDVTFLSEDTGRAD